MTLFYPKYGDYILKRDDSRFAVWNQSDEISIYDLVTCENIGQISLELPGDISSLSLDDSSSEDWERLEAMALKRVSEFFEKYSGHQNPAKRKTFAEKIGSLFTKKHDKKYFSRSVDAVCRQGDFIVEVDEQEFTIWNKVDPDCVSYFALEDQRYVYTLREGQGWDPETFEHASMFAADRRAYIKDVVEEESKINLK